MIDPLAAVLQIIHTDSSLAEPLIDIVLWATSSKTIRKTAAYDEVMERLYAQTSDSSEHRENYLASREADESSLIT